MKLEEHIFFGIEAFGRGEQEHALLHACIAVDAASQKRDKAEKSSRSLYIKFIRDYYWILEPMTGSAINFNDTFWNNIPLKDDKGEAVKNVDMAAVIYHLFRCTQAHGSEIQDQYKLIGPNENGKLGYWYGNNRLHIPQNLIFGLLSVCVFCETNKDIQTSTDHFFTLGNDKFLISEWWGKEGDFKPFAEKHNPIRVALNVPPFASASDG